MSTEKNLMLVGRGVLVPADELSQTRLREREYRCGDLVSVTITKPRNPGYHRLAHAFGQLIADNIDDFEGMDCHRVLKRLQWEANIGCEEMGVQMPGAGFVPIRIPKSLSFSSMDEGAFREVIRAMARHVAHHYWHDEVDTDEVLAMVDDICGATA